VTVRVLSHGRHRAGARARNERTLLPPAPRLTVRAALRSVRRVEPRIAVLASGQGTNLQALLDDPVVGGWVVLVVSDRAVAKALERARDRGILAAHLDPSGYSDRASYDHALRMLLDEERVGYVALAGFMRMLGPEVVAAFEDRIVNVHPALLPSFPGAHSVSDALAWGAKVTGVTVHLVDGQMDHGPIVAQEAVPVLTDDDWDSLETRIHEVEHRLLPAAVRALVEGRLRVEGRAVRVVEEPADG
jgi:phosphoribosylglycinamide formyltransferase-1